MYKVIVIDDEMLVRRGIVMETDWQALNCVVVAEAGNGIEGLEAVRKYHPDLLICDIRMPKMTGSEFLHYLKSNELFKHIPVMMLSSEESTTERIRLLEEGAVDYILKPFNPMELKVRLKKFI